MTLARWIGILTICALAASAAEPTYCAYEVKVSGASGAPLAKIPVGMVQRESQIASAWTDTQGMARLCDAPLHPVDIVIGMSRCGLVVVRNVKPAWPKTRQVFAIYVETPCNEFVFADHCQILLRVQDEDGQPVAGARFDGIPADKPNSHVSDTFGRIFRTVKRGERLNGQIIRDGWEPTLVSEACLPLGDQDLERKVIMRKP